MTNVRAWLRRSPVPAQVRADGKTLPMPPGARKWAELTTTIESLQPQLLEALDEQGNVLRATTFAEEPDTSGEPEGPVDAADKNMVALAQLGREMRLCVQSVSDNQAGTWKALVESLASIANDAQKRASDLQRDLDDANETIVELQGQLAALEAKAANNPEGLLGGLVQGIRAGQEQRAQKATNGHTESAT